MSSSLAKKFDKIVSKLGSKHKETKSNGNETIDGNSNLDDAATDESQHERILHRVKGHTHVSVKGEHQQQIEGAPPLHVIMEDLKDSPFKGKHFFYHMIIANFFCCFYYLYVSMTLSKMN